MPLRVSIANDAVRFLTAIPQFNLFAAILHHLVVMVRVVPILSLGVFAARKKYQQEKQQRGSFHRSLLHQRLAEADNIADYGAAQ